MVVFRAAPCAVASVLHAAVQKQRRKDMGAVVSDQLFGTVQGADHQVYEILDLNPEGLLYLLKGSEICQHAGFRPHLHAGHLADAVEESELQAFGQIEHACVRAPHRVSVAGGLHAADDGVVKGLLFRKAVPHQGRDDLIVIENRHLSAFLMNQNLQNTVDKCVRIFGGEADAGIGLRVEYVLLRVQAEVREIADSVVSIFIKPADDEIVRSGEASVVPHAGVGPGLDDVAVLDPEAFQNFLCFIPGQNSFRQIPFKIGAEDLIHAAVRDGGAILAAVIDEDHKPEGLYRFKISAGRLVGHASAVCRDKQKLLLSALIAAGGSHIFSQLCKAFLKSLYALDTDERSLIELHFFCIVRITGIQRLQVLPRFLFYCRKAFVKNTPHIRQVVSVSASCPA